MISFTLRSTCLGKLHIVSIERKAGCVRDLLQKNTTSLTGIEKQPYIFASIVSTVYYGTVKETQKHYAGS
jgi:hypothetical protein